ncbi:hypothetical protein [Sodalis endosymbiont of Henestaris halophilus]|uniref:hypothetical protein n=1 Tax=Sodalis endosymbiont of Henestaris halophilus TaxID=1929246 RepID=UPI000BBF5747|nr:hypothetical protein [Sodalis endosymbiont of Henestaris halophilus]SNC59141.1 hypothetical protein HBA_0931 [Sodalis endosymbiont of Henestaris halophilus]
MHQKQINQAALDECLRRGLVKEIIGDVTAHHRYTKGMDNQTAIIISRINNDLLALGV